MVERRKDGAVQEVPARVAHLACRLERIVLVRQHQYQVRLAEKRHVLPAGEHSEAVERIAEVHGKRHKRKRRPRGALRDFADSGDRHRSRDPKRRRKKGPERRQDDVALRGEKNSRHKSHRGVAHQNRQGIDERAPYCRVAIPPRNHIPIGHSHSIVAGGFEEMS